MLNSPTTIRRFIGIIILVNLFQPVVAQHGPTAEDSLSAKGFLAGTTLGGYGNVLYQRDNNLESSVISLERFVLFAGHKFNSKISVFSELEVENAKVAGGEEGGEIALEQCYVKFNLNPSHYIVAGLFIPRIGIINENHLPNTYNGNERPQVETLIIPSTWRELGVGFYGALNSFPLNYSVGLVNGLNSAAFEHGSVIRGGRFEGREASANNLAVTGAVQYYRNALKIQLSGYYGGTVGLSPREADSLKLTSGTFGTPVILTEADIQYSWKGFGLRALGTMISIPDASDINRAFANNTPSAAYGYYAELSYDVLSTFKNEKQKSLLVFARYEELDMNSNVPLNGIPDKSLHQSHIVTGITFMPHRNIAVKADVRFVHTGEQNPDLIVNPSPVAPPYEVNNSFLNIGLGYSF